MARENKPVELRPVDEMADSAEPVVRLENRDTDAREKAQQPVRLGPQSVDRQVSQRLDLPTRDEHELRTHQPGIEAIIEGETAAPELLEQAWGEESDRRTPHPWGWFALIGLTIFGAVGWSLSRVEQADDQADIIRNTTASALIEEQEKERQANQLIERIHRTLRDFFAVSRIEDYAPLVRQPQRVEPLMRRHYAPTKQLASPLLERVSMLQPLSFEESGDFWMASVELADGQTRQLVVEVLANGEARVDWETLVCYQPMDWDDFVAQRPGGKAVDFRVYAQRDNFYTHEFQDPTRWLCFRLTALDSDEPLYGYVPANSPDAKVLLRLIHLNRGEPTALILRLAFPPGAQQQLRRGVKIQRILSNRWLYIQEPDSGP